jgi:hypothetical protein
MKPAIHPSLLQSLGQLTVNFSRLELVVSFFIWELVGSDQRTGQIVTAGMPLRSLINLFCALYRHRVSDPANITTLDKIRKRLDAAVEKRNALLHSGWASAGQAGVSTRIKTTAKAKQGLKFTFEKTTASDIDTIASEMAVLTADVQDFMDATLSD